MLNTISEEHKKARYIEGHGKSGPGKSGDYCTTYVCIILFEFSNKINPPLVTQKWIVVMTTTPLPHNPVQERASTEGARSELPTVMGTLQTSLSFAAEDQTAIKVDLSVASEVS